jgi:hypothetical protein
LFFFTETIGLTGKYYRNTDLADFFVTMQQRIKIRNDWNRSETDDEHDRRENENEEVTQKETMTIN